MKKILITLLLAIPAWFYYNSNLYIFTKIFPESEEQEEGQAPLERAAWRLAQKGGVPISLQKLKQTKRSVDTRYEQQAGQIIRRDAGLTGWTELGPEGIGGRIRSIAIHPTNTNTMFIGSVSGGIWKTTNGGTTWSRINDFLPSLSVTQIVYDPNDSNIMYATTGEGVIATAPFGGGIFKSSNGGSSWTQLDLPSAITITRFANDIVVDPNNSNNLFAVLSNSNNGQVIRSTDAGANWTAITGTVNRVFDVKINPNNSSQLFVGGLGSFLVSNNALSVSPTFTAPVRNNMGGRVEIAIAPINANWVYILVDNNGVAEIWRCTDGTGLNWTLRQTQDTAGNPLNVFGTNSQGWYDNVIWVDPWSVGRLVVGGVDLWRSTDGGDSFVQISDWSDDINGNDSGGNNSIHADQHAIVTHPNYVNTDNQRIVFIGNDGGIYKTNDIRTVSQNSGWQEVNGDLAITQYYGADASVDGEFLIGGAQDNAFSFSSNSGSSWEQPNTGDGAYATVNYDDPDKVFANTNNNSIWRSRNGGGTWDRKTRFADQNCANANGCVDILASEFTVNDGASLISRFIMDPNDPDVLLAGAQRLWRNDQAGTNFFIYNWNSIKAALASQSTVSAIAVDDGNSSIIWVGYRDGTFESTSNLGTSWSGNLNDATMPNNMITDIAISPKNSNHVAVSIGGYNQTNIFVTTNGGTSWTNRSQDFDIQVNTVTWHPDKVGWLYCGTDFGVFASEDYGQNWSVSPIFPSDNQNNNNDGPVYMEISELFWKSTRLYAATYGRGMWKTNSLVNHSLYVNKDYTGIIQLGTELYPFKKFESALAVAGNGTEIIFISSGTHNEIPPEILIDKRVKISFHNSNSGPVIIE